MYKHIAPYIIILILGFALYRSAGQIYKYKEYKSILEETVSNLDKRVKYTEVRMNDSIRLYQAEIKTLNVTKDNLKAKYNKLLRASKTKPKDVGSVTGVGSEIHHIDTVYLVKDSLGVLKTELNDQFVRIKVAVNFDRSTIIDYKIRDSLTIVNIQKQHSILFGLIKWKRHKGVRVINHNPKAKIISLQSINVIE